MQPWRASLKLAKTRKDVPKAQALQLGGSEGNAQTAEGEEESSLVSTAATVDKAAVTATSVANGSRCPQ